MNHEYGSLFSALWRIGKIRNLKSEKFFKLSQSSARWFQSAAICTFHVTANISFLHTYDTNLNSLLIGYKNPSFFKIVFANKSVGCLTLWASNELFTIFLECARYELTTVSFLIKSIHFHCRPFRHQLRMFGARSLGRVKDTLYGGVGCQPSPCPALRVVLPSPEISFGK